MALFAGAFLGPYEILVRIGAGGMGEVYRARDLRLDRVVAIKVLPEHFCRDSKSRERFEREAKTISNLNHPHICTLQDVGHEDGVDFLVMEHLDGETLARRLEKGPLPTEQVLRYGVQLAVKLTGNALLADLPPSALEVAFEEAPWPASTVRLFRSSNPV
jgi:eukaryotic-like serine/threonine-protein kinase